MYAASNSLNSSWPNDKSNAAEATSATINVLRSLIFTVRPNYVFKYYLRGSPAGTLSRIYFVDFSIPKTALGARFRANGISPLGLRKHLLRG